MNGKAHRPPFDDHGRSRKFSQRARWANRESLNRTTGRSDVGDAHINMSARGINRDIAHAGSAKSDFVHLSQRAGSRVHSCHKESAWLLAICLRRCSVAGLGHDKKTALWIALHYYCTTVCLERRVVDRRQTAVRVHSKSCDRTARLPCESSITNKNKCASDDRS